MTTLFESADMAATASEQQPNRQEQEIAGRPTVAEVNLAAIARNLRRVSSRVAPAEVMAVVKADAYGHGAIPVARALLQAGASQLAVALLEEGLALRRAGITAPILVFGGPDAAQIESYLQYDLQMTLYAEEIARLAARRATALGKRALAHVKLDTGMGRVGIVDNPVEGVSYLQSLAGLELAGCYTHFATSDEADKTFAWQQLRGFQQILATLEGQGITFRWIHAANSGAILDLPESYFNLVRPGIMLYGYYPSPFTSESIPLDPALRLKTRILFVKQVPAGYSVSYGRTFRTRAPSAIATLPIGYADGYRRQFSNGMQVLIRDQRVPVVGRVCMDQIMIEVTDLKDVRTGDEVVLLGRQQNEQITMREWCETLTTIPYEVTCGISSRVPRSYIDESEN